MLVCVTVSKLRLFIMLVCVLLFNEVAFCNDSVFVTVSWPVV